MKRFLYSVLLSALTLVTACSGNVRFAPEQSSDNGDGTFTNPVLWSDCPDPDLIRVGDDYYLVTTTMHLMPGAPIMHSKDLVNWEIVSYIFDRLEETPYYSMEGGTVYGRGQWATSLRYKDGRFFAYFTPNDQPPKGWVYSTTDPKTEKWELYSVLPHFHDASFFFDDNGKAYMVYGSGAIRELKPDLTGVQEGGLDMQLFERDSEENSLLEGSRMIKKDGKYYLLMISWPRGGIRREVCYRADRIEGPYEKKVILETPFGGLGAGVAQGTIFDTPEGEWYGFIFQDRDGLGRAPMLMPCTWVDGWPMLGDKDGKVPERMQKPLQGEPVKGITKSDDFKEGKLGLHWQWNHNPVEDAWSLSERPGYLRLKTNKVVESIYTARNTITQRMEGPQSTATVCIDLKGMKDGDVAGFSAFNSDAAVLGVSMKDGAKTLTLTEESVRLHPHNKEVLDVKKKVAAEVPLKKDRIWLRIDADFRPGETRDIAKLWYSLDGKEWNRIGDDYRMRFDWQRFFMGTKFAIFNYATEETGGHVDVDYFDYRKINN
jgi:beta-xylosidase